MTPRSVELVPSFSSPGVWLFTTDGDRWDRLNTWQVRRIVRIEKDRR